MPRDRNVKFASEQENVVTRVLSRFDDTYDSMLNYISKIELERDLAIIERDQAIWDKDKILQKFGRVDKNRQKMK